MVAPLCCECKSILPHSQFAPRDNTVFDDDSKDALPSDEIWRQPRCDACNTLYAKRRRFMEDKLAPRARSLGLQFKTKNRSAFRQFVVLKPCQKEDLLEIELLISKFNDELPEDMLKSIHGIRLIPPDRIKAGQLRQGLLPLAENRPH